jgi:sugar lactone lactonase YvrE
MREHIRSVRGDLALLVATLPLALACSNQVSPQGSSGSPASSSGSSPGSKTGGDTPPSNADAGAGTPVNGGDGGSSSNATGDAGGDDAATAVTIDYVAGVTVSTLAGSDADGTVDGIGAAAEFDNPTGIAIDANGNLVVTDYDSSDVRLVTPAGVVTTIASATGFVNPFAAVVSSDGHYYVATDANSSGVKDTMTGTVWLVPPVQPGVVGTPTVVGQNFGRPRSLAPIAGGNIFVADKTQEVAELFTIAEGAPSVLAGSAGATGYVDATGALARFNGPVGAATMADGSFLVSDPGNNVIRRITAGGVVSTFAGNGTPTLVDGPCASASFNAARGVAIDAAGNVYVSDIGNQVIRRITVGCTVQTLAGTGAMGYADGPGSTAEFYGQEGIAVTPDGKTVYVADGNGGDGSAHHRVRAISIP